MCDVGTAQYDNKTIKCEKKIREPPNVIKVQSHVMLVLHNLMIVLSKVRKKYEYNRMWQNYGQM